MAQNLPVVLRHPKERLPSTAPQILESGPKINLEHSRFFINVEEFEAGINAICFQLWKIQSLWKFVGDLCMFAEFLSIFLTKEFVDPKSMFRKICRQYAFEFLLLFDLCREWKIWLLKFLCAHASAKISDWR